MISAILLDSQNNPVRLVKSVSNMFVAERAYDHATGNLVISVKNRIENAEMQKVRCVFFFGEGLKRLFVVTKVTLDATAHFPKVTFDLNGIEYALHQRNEGDKQTFWNNLTPPEVCADLVGYIQNSDPDRVLPPLYSEAGFEIPDSEWNRQVEWQLGGGNVWDYIKGLMDVYGFCCDARYVRLGVSKLYFRVPTDRKNIVISDISGKSNLQYVNTDYNECATRILVGGEGEGVRRKYAEYNSGETGIDRFEVYTDFSGSDIGGYISRENYTRMMETEAQNHYSGVKIEGDFKIPNYIYSMVRTGDTIYAASPAIDNGLLKPRKISELKFEITDGKSDRSITFV